ncbi:hypothetical protein GIB67_019375 [Kingdonia uniflora]|uniref:Omega-hydroxypalmitate O-feruloyl transferase n=1 Tax=Kingdonia uniflora TaxID=39325 RepID=A0A7J7M1N7_9MAGN|nr:hypothetical protein GIB67_019375 [Kingdonia uniflora]
MGTVYHGFSPLSQDPNKVTMKKNVHHAFPSTLVPLKSQTFNNISFSRKLKFPVSLPNVGSLCRTRLCRAYAVIQPLAAAPTTTDLRVTIQRTSMVTPFEETERRSMFLSNIDQSLNFVISSLHFFSNNPEFTPEIIIEKLEMACRKMLVPYDYSAGRLRVNPEQGRLEIDCNSAGSGFVIASSELSLDELGDLVNPNPAFQDLAIQTVECCHPQDQPLYILQVTFFKCGGFTIGFSFNHLTYDGVAGKIFLENLASLITYDRLVLPPYNNRKLLVARSPPRVTYPHPELLKLDLPINGGETGLTPFQLPSSSDLECKTFRLSAQDILSLKEKAKIGGDSIYNTSFNVVVAHIWRCKALATNTGNDPAKLSTILYAVNIRSKIRPRLPPTYAGNAILNAYWTTTCRELEETPFSRIVRMISQGSERMTDEYIKSVIDWGELNKGFPNGDVFVSSWWKLGVGDVMYPWGKPIWSCPVVRNHSYNIILLLPDIKGTSNTEGVNVVVALPHKQMVKFEGLFHKF